MVSSRVVSQRLAYQPRSADEQLVHRVVASEIDGFLAAAEARGHPLPSFVVSTFREFLVCGVPEHGFLRVHCYSCGRDRVVAFSCKRRGVCASCGGRRMAETAAHLVDSVLPSVPIRQWVLTLPFPLRYRLAYDRTLPRMPSSTCLLPVDQVGRPKTQRLARGECATRIGQWLKHGASDDNLSCSVFVAPSAER